MRNLITGILFFFSTVLMGKTIHVNGDIQTSGDGSQLTPFKTIQKAADRLQPGDICVIQEGIYPETVVVPRSGTLADPIVFKADGKVIITGADPVPTSEWKKTGEKIFMARVDMSLEHENQVFRGNKMMLEARWPNSGDDLLNPVLATMKSGTTPERIVDPELPDLDWTGANVWVHAPRYWANWTTRITDFDGDQLDIENVAPYPGPKQHVAAPDAEYFVYGCLQALDKDNEWYYDASGQSLFIYSSDGQPSKETIFVKKRMQAVDLRGKSHIHIKDIQITGANILTDEKSSHIVLDGLKIFYPYHSSEANKYYGTQTDKGIILNGSHCTISNSEIGYSSGCGIVLDGQFNRVLNCYVHDTDYIGTYASCVQLRGQGNIISHCTLSRTGRAVIDYGSMYQSLVQYNDMNQSGLLTRDTGLTYGNVIEAGNSEIRYNWLHDNMDDHWDMGLYYDHGTQNIISHHNVIWGINHFGFMINHYGYYHLVYNNTFSANLIGFRSTWGNQYGPDLHGCRFFNNIFNNPCETKSGNYVWGANEIGYKDLIDHKYLPEKSKCIDAGVIVQDINEGFKGKAPDLGAYEFGNPKWTAGHNFSDPPNIDTTRSLPLYRNRLINSAFEHQDHLQPWEIVAGPAAPNRGRKGQTTPDTARVRMGGWSLALGPKARVVQVVNGLEPDCWYEFAGFLRVDKNERAQLGVIDQEGKEWHSPSVSGNSPHWYRCILHLKTGHNQTRATVFVHRLSDGPGLVFADDFGLVLLRKD